MTMMELCSNLKNWFEIGVNVGNFSIIDGVPNVDFLLDGQYYRIIGSVFNDGVHKYPEDTLTNETFYGEIWRMAIPPDVISLAADINDWLIKNSAAINSPYSSESFGGYSYTLADAGSGSEGTGVTWQAKFRKRLNRYRKV